MFTDKQQVSQYLRDLGLMPEDIFYIDKGVMTDKYEFVSQQKRYIVRCYPEKRSWLAEVEYQYLDLFKRKGIKAPHGYLYNTQGQAFLVYEKLPGQSLTEVYADLTTEEKDSLCKEIVANYKKIAEISCDKFGALEETGSFSSNSWNEFLLSEISKATRIFQDKQNIILKMISMGLSDYAKFFKVDTGQLVWSDFSTDNIIVKDGHLVGFIDFEGLLAGDSLLGLGYLLAHEQKSDFVNRILTHYGVDGKSKDLDFYAVFRYIRQTPYLESALPNGTQRDSAFAFLPYVPQIMYDFSPVKGFLVRIFTSLKTYMLALTIWVSLLSLYFIPILYDKVLQTSQVSVPYALKDNLQCGEVPIWFHYNDSLISVSRPMGVEDKLILQSLVSDTTAIYKDYQNAVANLAYLSNLNHNFFSSLLYLTLCFVALGCTSRSLYDYIGHECFKGSQDMERWWPWYLYRLFICVPVTSILIVASRTSMFSSLFTSKDLNVYLVISFLAGFSVMEFFAMLRRVSKTLFEGK